MTPERIGKDQEHNMNLVHDNSTLLHGGSSVVRVPGISEPVSAHFLERLILVYVRKRSTLCDAMDHISKELKSEWDYMEFTK